MAFKIAWWRRITFPGIERCSESRSTGSGRGKAHRRAITKIEEMETYLERPGAQPGPAEFKDLPRELSGGLRKLLPDRK